MANNTTIAFDPYVKQTLWLTSEGRTLARVRSKATCYVLFISVLRKRGQPFQPINPQRDVYNTASNGPIRIAVNTKFAPSAVAYSSCSSVCANSSLTFHFSCTDILQRAQVVNSDKIIAITKTYRLCQNVPITITTAGNINDKYHHKLYRAAINSSIFL